MSWLDYLLLALIGGDCGDLLLRRKKKKGRCGGWSPGGGRGRLWPAPGAGRAGYCAYLLLRRKKKDGCCGDCSRCGGCGRKSEK